jgi:hypothetical protein
LASSKDAEKLAEAVLWISRNPEETARVVAGKQRKVKERYDKVSMYDSYGSLYTSLVEGTPWRA